MPPIGVFTFVGHLLFLDGLQIPSDGEKVALRLPDVPIWRSAVNFPDQTKHRRPARDHHVPAVQCADRRRESLRVLENGRRLMRLR